MSEHLLSLTNLPQDGRRFQTSDPAMWDDLLSRHGAPFSLERVPEAEVLVRPSGKGYFIQGSLEGAVLLSCDRCAESVATEVSASFDHFEEPGHEPETGEGPEERVVVTRDGEPMLDVASLLWQFLLLELPLKVLCAASCKGICPTCGADLNEGECACEAETGDPRLAPLRGLKIDKD
ncbi:DUF177 domain-containing protein [Desulfohalovibrio reitneri]|uniref:DUF177 domain-containing protein n=1 Tax=Desulfohalovibrio reitneri TaxID=1307759 RepID=UPI0004A6DDEA|nr:DUF177 domain-containing protein [Desulfohalovibrio reitneri]